MVKIKGDNIVCFYTLSYLYALTQNKYHAAICKEYAWKSLEIFRQALYWELFKAQSVYPSNVFEYTKDCIIKYISSFPKSLHERTLFLGDRWLNIAKIILSANDANIITTIDNLVDLEHNNGNILNRILLEYTRYKEFITVKSYATDIRELITFCDNSRICKMAYRESKQIDGSTKRKFEDNYMSMIGDRYSQMEVSNSVKQIDLENTKRLLQKFEYFDSTNILRMMKTRSYDWCGKMIGELIQHETISNSKIISGKFDNCVIKNTNIDGGHFVSCIFYNCAVLGNPVIEQSSLNNTSILEKSSATIEQCDYDNIKLYSDKCAFINAPIPPVELGS